MYFNNKQCFTIYSKDRILKIEEKGENNMGHPKDPKGKEWGGGMLLFRALGGIGDEGRHGQKMKKFWEKIGWRDIQAL